jgi:acyl carrier protein
MRLDEIESVILELLAEDAGCSATEFRDRLRSGGRALPIDSLLAAEIVAHLQDGVGVELPATAETARALRSVRSFAIAVHKLLPPDEASREWSA